MQETTISTELTRGDEPMDGNLAPAIPLDGAEAKLAPSQAAADSASDAGSDSGNDAATRALREELAKWQARVPKLAAALKQRSAEVEALESKVQALEAGQPTDLEQPQARSESAAPADTRDAQNATIRQQELELTVLRERSRSLESRNEKLFETIELANRQIEILGENLEQLRDELQDQKAQLAARDAQTAEPHGQAPAAEEAANLDERGGDPLAQSREIQRLEECVAQATAASARWEDERRQLSSQIEALQTRCEDLESELEERSLPDGAADQNQNTPADGASILDPENAQLTAALEAAEARLTEQAEHIAQVEDGLSRQTRLMEGLEQEFAQVQKEFAEATETHELELQAAEETAHSAQQRADELARALEDLNADELPEPEDQADQMQGLQAEVVKLEGLVRERTEELNQLRWQQDMTDKEAVDGSESAMLVVLNQQLASAREDNQRLLETIRELESRVAESGVAAADGSALDDLVKIRGIGPKLFRQLIGLGVTRFEQIATLSEADLDDPGHPLHGMKGRIVKDRWIEQAARFVDPS